jgi:hypothetical protein
MSTNLRTVEPFYTRDKNNNDLGTPEGEIFMADKDNDYYSTIDAVDEKLRAAELSLQREEAVSAKAAELPPDPASTNIGNIDKIRDILFGGYMRDYDKRFRRFEEHLTQARLQLRDELLQRIKSLEDMLTSETETLIEKNKVERQERYDGQQELARELSSLKNEINNRIAQLDEQTTKDMKQLRQQTHNRLQELTVQVRQQGDNLAMLIKQESAQLREEKVGRSDLAAFFTEFAMRLNKDFPTKKDFATKVEK